MKNLRKLPSVFSSVLGIGSLFLILAISFAGCNNPAGDPCSKGHSFQWTASTVWGMETEACSRCAEPKPEGGLRLAANAMAPIPAGKFQMGKEGGSNTVPVREVTLSAFRMGKYLITQEQYLTVMGENPSENLTGAAEGEDQNKRPVERVKWYEALIFCNKLSVMAGLTPAYSINESTNPDDWGTVPTMANPTWDAVIVVTGSTGYRLPTEAQWEYACRAGTTTPYYWDDADIDLYAWYSVNSSTQRTREVGLKKENPFGLYDMSGNVFEWCWDWYGTYPDDNEINPTGPDTGSGRVWRGGSHMGGASWLDSAYRIGGTEPFLWFTDLGIRVVLP